MSEIFLHRLDTKKIGNISHLVERFGLTVETDKTGNRFVDNFSPNRWYKNKGEIGEVIIQVYNESYPIMMGTLRYSGHDLQKDPDLDLIRAVAQTVNCTEGFNSKVQIDMKTLYKE